MSRKSTMYTFLMHGTGTETITYAKLCDIIDYPDLEGAPNTVDATTLSDDAEQSVPGIKQGSQYTFAVPYEKTTYQAIKALEGAEDKFAIWLGATVSGDTVTPDGSDGKFAFNGYISVGKSGGGVDDLSTMTVTINRTSAVAFS